MKGYFEANAKWILGRWYDMTDAEPDGEEFWKFVEQCYEDWMSQ